MKYILAIVCAFFLIITPSRGDTVYHVPVVVHIIHDYGYEVLKDSDVVNMLAVINKDFSKRNADTINVIPPFAGNIPGTNVRYIGNANIEFHLAQKDPQGNPTHGINHMRSPLTEVLNGSESRLGQWPPDRYLNIWVVRVSGASAYIPSYAAMYPYLDGILVSYSYFTGASGRTHMDALTAAYLNLASTYFPGGCQEDSVDDTLPIPPSLVYNCIPGFLYDTTCSYQLTTLGKTSLPAPLSSHSFDTSTADGISFHARTGVTLRSVVIYPAADSGTEFKVVLTQNSNTLYTYADTIRTSHDTIMTLPLNFRIPPGSGYELRFGKNPKARGNNFSGFYAGSFPGTVYFDNDTNSIGKYNYFYKWTVSYGYFKIYGPNDSLVDYPDTANIQSFMYPNGCGAMFTNGQAQRMRAALNSPVANRNQLITPVNAATTGINDPHPALPPVADFNPNRSYVCADGNTPVTFTDFSWNDTILSHNWTFSNGASIPVTMLKSPAVTFSQPGWVTASLAVQSLNGTHMLTRSDAVYAADAVAVTNPDYFFQEFKTASENERWPIFNPYHSDHQWEVVRNTGYFDQSCIRFANVDNRLIPGPASAAETPAGVYGDFYTPAFDLYPAQWVGPFKLTFFSSGAYRTVNNAYKNDTLQIAYSTTCGHNWIIIANLRGDSLGNNGYVNAPFTPSSQSQWQGNTITLPQVAMAKKVFFRFRFKVGTDKGGLTGYSYGTGNHFYLDRINITTNPLGVLQTAISEKGILLVPNPTRGDAFVLIRERVSGQATVIVTDIAGSTVYKTSAQTNAGVTVQIQIPAEKIAAKGIYLVRVLSGDHSRTEKLVVY